MKRLYIFIILLAFAATMMAQAPSGYYDSADGLTGEDLRAALHNIIKNDKPGGGTYNTTYNGLWDAYQQTDAKPNGYVWDIYSNVNFSFGDNQCGTYNKEGDCYNREHLWAQSWTNNDGTEKTDLHHVFPTDGYVNNRRDNYAFGEVSSPTYTSGNGGKLGPCTVSGYSGTVFEPIDEYKGDIARALMYVSVRYYSQDSGWKSNQSMTDKSVIKPWAITMLLQWHENDPVSQKEIDRNNAVYTIQQNRNPFVDHPEFAEQIWAPSSSYQIYASASPSNAGTVSGAGTYTSGHTCTLTATANPGYTFVNWTKGGTQVSTNSTYTFTVSAGGTYVANFASETYLIAVEANPQANNMVYIGEAPTSSTTHTAPITFSDRYNSNTELYDQSIQFDDSNVSVYFNKTSNNSPKTLYNASDKAVRAYWGNYFVISTTDGNITSITFEFASGENSNTISTNVGTYNATTKTWTGEESSVRFTIGGTSGHRRLKTISVTYETGGGVPVIQKYFNYNETATITAVPDDSYFFTCWTKNNAVVSTNPTYSFQVTEAGTYQANFISTPISSNTTAAALTMGANTTLTISSGAKLTVSGTITQASGAKIVIEDGGQFVNSTSGINGKVKKNITAWNASNNTGWNTIATPVNNVAFANVTNLTNVNYDIYRLNETSLTWENSQDSHNIFSSFVNGRGYIYRKANSTTIEFNGTLNISQVTYPLTYTSESTKGFHLIGNPYPHNIYKGDNAAIPNTWLEGGFYTITSAGGFVAGTDNSTAIAPCQSILVQAKTNASGHNLEITKNPAKSADKDSDDYIMFAVSNSNYEDVAYAVFKKGHGLNKIEHRNEDIQKLYIQHNGEDFAIADIDENERQLNLNFRATTTGRYTMKIKTAGDFSYLHLIDAITGEDIDLLLDDEYSFIGTPSDKESRFIVKLNYHASGSSTGSETFAYESGDEIVVEGEGEFQIFDITGRMVANQRVTGVEKVRKPSQGVYILRLLGNEVKTQKIIVK